MIEGFTKSLSYFLTAMSVPGIIILLFSDKSTAKKITLVSIIAISLFWRGFCIHNSSRYYSVIIFYGILLSAFFANSMLHVIRKSRARNVLFCFLIILLIFAHFAKILLSFRNSYIFDLQNISKDILRKHRNDYLCVVPKEYYRLKSDISERDSNRFISFPPDSSFDMSDFYIRNSIYTNAIYFVIPEKYKRTPVVISPFIRKIGSFISNNNHNSSVAIYKHSPYTPHPNIDLESYFNQPILKAYEPLYDAFIYQTGNQLVWLIGKEIDNQTIIIYQTYTNKPELLPKWRVQYGFDNQVFRCGDKYESDRIGKYRVFIKDLPGEYPVTAINIAFKTADKSVWTRSFSPTN